jgi:alkylation response protein AidB-like acyl-CoA dehydrogenase
MDFAFTPEEEAFRLELRTWLRENLPQEIPTNLQPTTSQHFEFLRQWQKTVYKGGWAGVSWPKEYGGRGATLIERMIFDQEMAQHKAPPLINVLGLEIIGPTIMHYGTEEQKKRYLQKILSSDEIWCQGYSEPGSGSDLGSLKTRAMDQGDYFVVSGQKVWTSLASFSERCLLLVRTNPDVPKHKGLSCLLVDMQSPGITVRPLRTMTGEAEFNEVFFDEVKVPKENLLGQKDDGWKPIITSLMYERQGLGFYFTFALQQSANELVQTAKGVSQNGQPVLQIPFFRQKLAQAYIDSELLRLNNSRALTRMLRGEPAGPEGSIAKLHWAESNQRLQELAMEIAGPLGLLGQGSNWALEDGLWQYEFLRSRANSIEGGTSEIQRNILAERVLGLPKAR